jgi:beta-barrel assembly-enhancing protease
MTIRVHYSERPEVNAFATLGGNVVVFRGLLARVRSENELAMVLAHEIAHVKHRHPIVSLGRGLAIGAVLATVSSSAGNSVAGNVMQDAGLLTQLTFTRGQEEDADATGLEALVAVYGHAGGATDLFETLTTVEGGSGAAMPQLLRTHPHLSDRVLRMQTLAQQRGWRMDHARQPLPDEIAGPLKSDAAKSSQDISTEPQR